MLLPDEFQSLVSAPAKKDVERLLRTITAACVDAPLDDLIAQAWAPTWAAIDTVEAQLHVLELLVIGFVLP